LKEANMLVGAIGERSVRAEIWPSSQSASAKPVSMMRPSSLREVKDGGGGGKLDVERSLPWTGKFQNQPVRRTAVAGSTRLLQERGYGGATAGDTEGRNTRS
jgi:hypothetical protein